MAPAHKRREMLLVTHVAGDMCWAPAWFLRYGLSSSKC